MIISRSIKTTPCSYLICFIWEKSLVALSRVFAILNIFLSQSGGVSYSSNNSFIASALFAAIGLFAALFACLYLFLSSCLRDVSHILYATYLQENQMIHYSKAFVLHFGGRTAVYSLSRSHQEWWSAARAAHRINLLHPARSSVSLVVRSVLTDVHFVMLLLYDVFGLPRLRFPLTFPWITHFTSSHPPSLMVCPKKESLRRTTNPRSCLVVPSSVRMLSSVLCSVQLTRNIRR